MSTETIVKRINSIDAMRGLVILLMLLDHVRERFFLHMQVSDPMLISETSASLFWSRFAAHFCAPIFIFLTGLSAWLFAQSRQFDLTQTRQFLWRRGLFLLLLEVTLVTFSWMGSYHTIWLQVIWAIGLCMLVLAVCVNWPRWLLLSVGLLLVGGHNLLTPINLQPEQWGYSLWTILHDRGWLLTDAAVNIKVSYPVLPWIGVILLGYAAGPLYAKQQPAAQRLRWLLWLGIGCLLAFALLRGGNLYGETLPWQMMDSVAQTLMSVFNVTKYPPSLNFLLVTLGVMFIALALLEKYNSRLNNYLSIYGGAPMFFYLLHLYLLLALYQLALAYFGANQGDYFGVDSMAQVWLISALLAFALYWPTRRFAQYKRASRQAWIKYL
ncbi:DUF1624 domain-containing protein [Idiomarina xiamenensis]|uniref:Heparan-alpha-glucosaminide N-acetyltransferase catalytic domain-containing protein n=1 Tax=Idiomarina xiamenensis 10-D-4 TaxID=740709 RepID=K2KD50_9GAMM|nr:heparan-alpha-glucosaminide N-acetyltransferase domain-containing protein [Idiomarina xiamenensis]EKE80629.1 hypothetical protein A10D4_11741 [Idiomarina xiamenensis 10-D-4]